MRTAIKVAAAIAVGALAIMVGATPAAATSPGFVKELSVGVSPAWVKLSPDGARAYVADQGDGTIKVIDTATQTVSDSWTLGGRPIGLAISPDGQTLYTSDFNANAIRKISTATGTVVGSVTVGTNPFGLAISEDGATLYAADYGSSSVSVVDTASLSVTHTVGVGSNPMGLALSPGGARLWVANPGSSNVSVIDPSNASVVATLSVGANPADVAFLPNGSRAYVTNAGANTVAVVETTTGVTTATIALDGTPSGVKATPDGSTMVVTKTSGGVSLIDVATGQATSVSGPWGAFMVDITGDGRYAYVTDRDRNAVNILDLKPVPAPPAAPQASAGDGSATVALADGAEVGDYTITAKPGAQTCTIHQPSTECSITGLTNGQPYVFVALETGGTVTSAESAPVTPRSAIPATALRIIGHHEVARGDAVRVEGTGYAPGESVAVSSAGGPLAATTIADRFGDIALAVPVPDGAALGTLTLTASGASHQATAAVTIVAPAVVSVAALIPKTPAAQTPVKVVDITNDSPQAKFAARALEGIINRDGAKVYLYETSIEHNWVTDSGDFSGRGHIDLPGTAATDPGLVALLTAYPTAAHSIALYDTEREWTFDIAMTAAGIHDALPIDASLVPVVQGVLGTATPTTDYSFIGQSREAAYRWAIDEQLPATDRSAAFYLGLRSDWQTLPWRLYDYATATRGFVFNLDWTVPAQQALATEIMKRYPAKTPVMGYSANCGDCGASMAFTNGLYWYAADLFGNASLWSSFPSTSSVSQRAPQATAATADTIYVTFNASDGDNLSYNQNVTPRDLKDPSAATLPYGYSISPLLLQLASPMASWLYANTPASAELVGGPDGLGYPGADTPDPVWSGWLQDNATTMSNAGITSATLWDMGDVNSTRTAQYVAAAPGITGTFLGYYGGQGDIKQFGATQIAQDSRATTAGVSQIEADLRAQTPDASKPRFITYQTYSGPTTPTDVAAMIARLATDFPGRFVFLAPKDYVATYLAYADPAPAAPAASRAPSVSGEAAVGKTLSADSGEWSPPVTVAYQWVRDGEPIAGATGSTYRVAPADIGSTIAVSVTATTGAGGSARATSTGVFVRYASTLTVTPNRYLGLSTQSWSVTVAVSSRASIAPGGTVTVLVGSKAYSATLVNGRAVIPLAKQAAGIRPISAAYTGSDTTRPSYGMTAFAVIG
ncbi:glutaminyl-peptide cyclotransferase [Leifsonia shinshuensis]|uniref:glutaminyl-peptide cyclotransferase n=1 Tax=Leifsonia shinshuensis TaxID=150026 RepID=UPI001F50F022|nr:glutaminyl-peptide cyclotransferase [Leifsonia shinshuensis]MCI0157763.1 glutaminyl-peptide cyclotransferase [Leifsonia shinshuensis]